MSGWVGGGEEEGRTLHGANVDGDLGGDRGHGGDGRVVLDVAALDCALGDVEPVNCAQALSQSMAHTYSERRRATTSRKGGRGRTWEHATPRHADARGNRRDRSRLIPRAL